METKTVTSAAIWYHVSAWSAESSARWALGAARKGNYDARQNISIIQFKSTDLADAIGDGELSGADLVLRRDGAFGTGAVNVCIAPANVTGSLTDKYMSRSQCLEMANRPLHRRYTIQGDTAVFPITGAMLREIKAGSANAFLLYQEDGTDSYCRLSMDATLNLFVGTDEWTAPSWTRTVSAGDVISSNICSHVADLREIEYYINMRRLYNGLNKMADIGTNLDVGAYADWAGVILALQDGADGFLSEEQRTVEWIVPEAGAMPRADIIGQLKDSIGGQDARKNGANGFTAEQTFTSANFNYKTSVIMTWKSEDPAKAGTVKKSFKINVDHPDAPRTMTVWDTYVTGWIFDLGTRTIATATVELTVKKADKEQPHLTLYGITAETVPVSQSYGNVFHAEIIGEADAEVGRVTGISINARGLQLINSGTIHGVGLRYDNDYVEVAQEARLMFSTLAENNEE